MRKIQKVLLINPFLTEKEYNFQVVRIGGQFTEDPLGLRYLKAYLKEYNSDIEVKIYDANLEAVNLIKNKDDCSMDDLWEMVKDEVINFQPDLVGVSCLFHFISFVAHRTCYYVKSVSRDIVTVMGGAYPTVSYNKALADHNLDYAIFSEGEIAFSKLIAAISNGEEPDRIVDGFAYRGKNCSVEHVSKKTFLGLETLLWPDRYSPSTKHYTYRPRYTFMRVLDPDKAKVATMISSRGCPHRCSFCSTTMLWGNRIRHRSVDDIINEMKSLIDEFGINTLVFNDDNTSVNKKFILKLCNSMIKSKIKVNWITYGLQLATLTDEVVQALYETGYVLFNLGIETGNPDTLIKIRKPLRLDIVPEVIQRIRKYGDGYVMGMFIVGLPFETKEDILDTLKFAAGLDLDWKGIFCYKPYPGTEAYDYCVDRGYVESGLAYSDFNSGDYNYAADFSTEHFTPDWVEHESYIANLKINFFNNTNLNRGNIEQAIRDFNFVLNFEPNHAVAYYALSKAYSLINAKNKAIESLQMAKNIVSTDTKWKKYFQELLIDV